MVDLNSLFRPGAESGLIFNAVFTNRVDELAEFERARRELRLSQASQHPGNLDLPRMNVVNFFGMGGIGKTTLSKEVEIRLRRDEQLVATMRLDLDEADSFDLESVILRLRATAGFLSIPLIAFDIGLAHYWQRFHPGETLDVYIAKNSRLQRAASKVGLSEHVSEAIKEVASSLHGSSTLTHVGIKSVQTIVSTVRHGRSLRHAIDGCRFLAPMLEADVDTDFLSFLPALMAWDLRQRPDAEMVVFIDTYEKLDQHQVTVERLLQRAVFLLPNVLFFITGRNKMQWSDSRRMGELDYVGETIWPQLGTCPSKGGRCRLVGNLSPVDAERYLVERVTQGAAAAIPPNVRTKIVEAANGLPLYLDLAAAHFVEVAATGAELHEHEFGDPFPALVARLMNDLSKEQRDILRGVSLLSSFDRKLARVAGGGVTDGAVKNLLARSFVKVEGDGEFRYSLHATLRTALAAQDGIESDAWGEDDWKDAAVRIFRSLGERLAPDADRETVFHVCQEGLRLCDRFDLDLDWVADATERLYWLGSPVSLESPESFALNGAAGALAHAASVIGARGRNPVRESERQLGKILQRDLLEGSCRAWLEVVRGDCRMDLGDYIKAEESYRTVLSAASSPRAKNNASVSLRLLLTKAGRFKDSLKLRGTERFDDLRIEAGAYKVNAMWREAEQNWLEALEIALRREHSGVESMCRTSLAIVDAWTRAGDGGQARSAARFAVESGGGWSYPAALVAEALALAGLDRDGASRARERAREEARKLDLHDNKFDVLLADAFDAAVSGDQARLEAVKTELESALDQDGAHPQYSDLVSWWAGAGVRPTTVQWLGGAEAARIRWLDTIASRRAAIASRLHE